MSAGAPDDGGGAGPGESNGRSEGEDETDANGRRTKSVPERDSSDLCRVNFGLISCHFWPYPVVVPVLSGVLPLVWLSDTSGYILAKWIGS